MFSLPIIQLRPHQPQALFRYPVGMSAGGFDGLQLFELAEELDAETGVEPAVPRVAVDGLDFLVFGAFDFNAPALSEQMQDTLFCA